MAVMEEEEGTSTGEASNNDMGTSKQGNSASSKERGKARGKGEHSREQRVCGQVRSPKQQVQKVLIIHPSLLNPQTHTYNNNQIRDDMKGQAQTSKK
jgi:hypothetical protein